MKLIKYHESGAELSVYTYLTNVAYQVRAHFEWNLLREDMKADRIEGKHAAIIRRTLEREADATSAWAHVNARLMWNRAGLETLPEPMMTLRNSPSALCSMDLIIRMRREETNWGFASGNPS